MPRRVLIQRDNESFDLVETPAQNEHHLQEIMKGHPQLIPADDLGIDGDLLVVGRETALASGYIDLLCLSRAGDVVLIEFKTGPQNPDFRHALAQLVDYGSDLWGLSVEDFDRGVIQRYLSGSHSAPGFAGATNLFQAIELAGWDLSEEESDALVARLADVLLTGDFHFVVAAQRFTAPMQTSLAYLNATMSFGRFYLVEIVQMQGGDVVAHAATVVASPLPKRSPGSGTRGPSDKTDESAFLAGVIDATAKDVIGDIVASCAALGLEVKWRSVGASIRILTTDRRQPLSIGWLLPDGKSWYTARHVTFGFDPSSLSKTPSVDAAVRKFAERVAAIPGARPAGGTLVASVFEPVALGPAVTALVSALEKLAAEIAAN